MNWRCALVSYSYKEKTEKNTSEVSCSQKNLEFFLNHDKIGKDSIRCQVKMIERLDYEPKVINDV